MKHIIAALALMGGLTGPAWAEPHTAWINPAQLEAGQIAQTPVEPEVTGSVSASPAATAPQGAWISPALLNPQPVRAESNAGQGTEGKSGKPAHPYHAIIDRHAEAHGIPVAWARAVVHVESRYNPRATGRAGEIGLMQIKLRTARGMGFSGSRKALYDPETNIKYGMLYLARAYELAGGDLCGTILRYNAGHYAKRMSAGPRRYCGKVRNLIGA